MFTYTIAISCLTTSDNFPIAGYHDHNCFPFLYCLTVHVTMINQLISTKVLQIWFTDYWPLTWHLTSGWSSIAQTATQLSVLPIRLRVQPLPAGLYGNDTARSLDKYVPSPYRVFWVRCQSQKSFKSTHVYIYNYKDNKNPFF